MSESYPLKSPQATNGAMILFTPTSLLVLGSIQRFSKLLSILQYTSRSVFLDLNSVSVNYSVYYEVFSILDSKLSPQCSQYCFQQCSILASSVNYDLPYLWSRSGLAILGTYSGGGLYL